MPVISSRYTENNWELIVGDDLIVTVTVKDAAGAAVDITGATLNYTLNTASAVTLTGVITNASGGVFTLTFLDTATAGKTAGTYSHQCQLTDSTGLKSTLFTGKVKLIADLIA